MKLRYLLPIIAFLGLGFFFYQGLKQPAEPLELATQNTRLPDFYLPALFSEHQMLSRADLSSEKPYYLMNIWGSWCKACYAEHPFLLALSHAQPLFGVNWKDDHETATAFLQTRGNPYRAVIVDDNSELAMNMGVYGAPETFLLRDDASIIYRHAGVLTPAVWESEFVPKIEQLMKHAKND